MLNVSRLYSSKTEAMCHNICSTECSVVSRSWMEVQWMVTTKCYPDLQDVKNTFYKMLCLAPRDNHCPCNRYVYYKMYSGKAKKHYIRGEINCLYRPQGQAFCTTIFFEGILGVCVFDSLDLGWSWCFVFGLGLRAMNAF